MKTKFISLLKAETGRRRSKRRKRRKRRKKRKVRRGEGRGNDNIMSEIALSVINIIINMK
jgi:hypothetical protein